MITNEDIPENLVVVRKLCEIHPYKPTIEQRSAEATYSTGLGALRLAAD